MARARAAGPRVPIVLYHSISSSAEPEDAPFTLSAAQFREHLEMLRTWGANTMTVSKFVEHIRLEQPLPDRSVVITFDDAYADTVDTAMPILLDLGMTATVYVTTGYVDQTIRGKPMIGWRGVRTLHECGFEVGAHSVSHPQLDLIPAEQALIEIRESKHTLQDALGAPVLSYAYPHGYYTRSLQRSVARSAYTSACAVRNAVSHPGDDVYALSRLMLRESTTTQDLHRLLIEGKAPLSRPGRGLKTRGWRAYRSLRHRVPSQRRDQSP